MDELQKRNEMYNSFERATKLGEWNYNGAVCWALSNPADLDELKFFDSVQDLREYCREENVPCPAWVFAAEARGLVIDAVEVVNRYATNDGLAHARGEVSDEEIEVLQKMLDEWCARQDLTLFEPNFEIAVLLLSE